MNDPHTNALGISDGLVDEEGDVVNGPGADEALESTKRPNYLTGRMK